MPVINLSGTPMTGTEQRIKTAFDRVVSTLLSLLLSPLFLLIALLVRLSGPGPVLFRQKRHGIGGDAIEIFKFRTMKNHAEVEGEVDQATREDERITPIGRFLRRSSLDELPQLFNVVLGEMSLVGPRPHPIELQQGVQIPHPQIHAPPQGQTRHHRLGTGKRLSRHHRHRRKNGAKN